MAWADSLSGTGLHSAMDSGEARRLLREVALGYAYANHQIWSKATWELFTAEQFIGEKFTADQFTGSLIAHWRLTDGSAVYCPLQNEEVQAIFWSLIRLYRSLKGKMHRR